MFIRLTIKVFDDVEHRKHYFIWKRFIFQDSQGKSVQISSEAFQKLLASRSIRPAGSGQTIVSTQSPQSGNIIRIQRPQSGDASVVQVVQRPVVKTDGPRQTVVKVTISFVLLILIQVKLYLYLKKDINF